MPIEIARERPEITGFYSRHIGKITQLPMASSEEEDDLMEIPPSDSDSEISGGVDMDLPPSDSSSDDIDVDLTDHLNADSSSKDILLSEAADAGSRSILFAF